MLKWLLFPVSPPDVNKVDSLQRLKLPEMLLVFALDLVLQLEVQIVRYLKESKLVLLTAARSPVLVAIRIVVVILMLVLLPLYNSLF